jgi:hypothetical protein
LTAAEQTRASMGVSVVQPMWKAQRGFYRVGTRGQAKEHR